MPSNVFQGKRVRLRAIEPDDWSAFMAMDEDTEVARASHLIPFPRNKVQYKLRYYFGELRYQKCTVFVYSFNEASLKLHKKLGFQQEGRLRRMIFTNGAYHDEIVLGLTVEEFATR